MQVTVDYCNMYQTEGSQPVPTTTNRKIKSCFWLPDREQNKLYISTSLILCFSNNPWRNTRADISHFKEMKSILNTLQPLVFYQVEISLVIFYQSPFTLLCSSLSFFSEKSVPVKKAQTLFLLTASVQHSIFTCLTHQQLCWSVIM